MIPTNKELEEMGFDTYSDKQKAETLNSIPKIDTSKYNPITKDTKHSKYPFLDDISDLIDTCRKMPIDPWKIAEIACQALENSIINEFDKGKQEEKCDS